MQGTGSHFRRQRRRAERQPPMAAAFGLRLVFDAPVPGPIALGYGSHYGLGMLVPERKTGTAHA